MTENTTSLPRDGNVIQNSFDYFDEFLKNHEIENGGNIRGDSDLSDDGGSSSSSSYYEEEILEDNIVRTHLRLDTVHENDASDSNDEEVSETEVFWEEVSESFHCGSDTADDGEVVGELETNSDMIARVRNIMRGDNNGRGESSLVDSSSRCSSASDEGSSSVLPLDFDLGSYEEDGLYSSDEEGEIPKDYEQACRVMIAHVHPHLDPNTMLHGCDLQNLYTNLKQQYRHLLRNKIEAPKSDINNADGFEVGRVICEDDDVKRFTEISFKSRSESHQDIVSRETIVDNLYFNQRKKASTIEYSNDASNIDYHKGDGEAGITPRPKVEKWLDRDQDDPEDYEIACRRLCKTMYDENDPEYDIDMMLRRSTPIDLYRYLKRHFWYLVHTNQLDENTLYQNDPDESGEIEYRKEKYLECNDVNQSATMSINMLDSNQAEDISKSTINEIPHLPSNNVESLRSLFTVRIKTQEQSKKRKEKWCSETAGKNIQNGEKDTLIDPDQASITERSATMERDTENLRNWTFTQCDQSAGTKKTESIDENKANEEKDACIQCNKPLAIEKVETIYKSMAINEKKAFITFDQQSGKEKKSDNNEKTDYCIECNESFITKKAKTTDDLMHSHEEKAFTQYSENNKIKGNEIYIKEVESKGVEKIEEVDIIKVDGIKVEHNKTENSVTEYHVTENDDNDCKLLKSSNRNRTEILCSEDKNELLMTENLPSCFQKSSYDDNGVAETTSEKFIMNSLNTGTEILYIEKEVRVHGGSEEIDVNEAYDTRCNSFPERCDGLLVRHENEEDIDENRACLLELKVGKIQVEKSLEDDNHVGEHIFDQEKDHAYENEERTDSFVSTDSAPKMTCIDSIEEGMPLSSDSRDLWDSARDGTDKLILADYSLTQGLRSESRIDFKRTSRQRKNPKELELRRVKLEEDLKRIIKEAEEEELQQSISSEITAALDEGSLKTAFTKKYFHPILRDHIYYPSVAKVMYNFSLIDEAEKVFRNEFSFEISTALCTVAASHVKEEAHELDGSDISVRKATTTVVLEDEIEASSNDEIMRAKMIELELTSIIHIAELQAIHSRIEPIVALAFQNAAYSLAYIKRCFDTKTEKHFYFPSVAKIILNFSLIEEAKKYLAEDGKKLSSELTMCLWSTANLHLRDTKNVSGDGLRKISVDVNLQEITDLFGDSCNANREKYERKFSTGIISENEIRKKRIRNALLSIIKNAEKNDKLDEIEDEAFDALVRAANEIVFIKKYYNVTTDIFHYFPSVEKTILDHSLTERAQDFYFDGVQEFPLDYISALRAAAAQLRGDYDFDMLDGHAINMAINVEIDNTNTENQSEKYGDFFVTNDITQIVSSQIDGSSLTTAVLNHINEGDTSSCRKDTNKNGDEQADCGGKVPIATYGCIDDLKTELDTDSTSQFQCVDKNIFNVGSSLSKEDNLQSFFSIEDCVEDESAIKKMSLFQHRVNPHEECRDADTSEDIKKVGNSRALDGVNQNDKNEIAKTVLDNNTSPLMGIFLDEREKNDLALVDPESESMTELCCLDNEANACSLEHKLEAERIEKDRKRVEEQFPTDENNIVEQTKALLEKLSMAMMVLEVERGKNSIETDTVEVEKYDFRKWFNKINEKLKLNDLEKEKQNQERLSSFKLREIELEKSINEIKAQLDFVEQQRKAKNSNTSEWRYELENLTYVNEEKPKEEMMNLHISFEEARERLIQESRVIKDNQKEGEERTICKEEKLYFKCGLEVGRNENYKIENNEVANVEEGHPSKNACGLREELLKKENDILLERKASEGGEKKNGVSSNTGDNLEIGNVLRLQLVELTTGEPVLRQPNLRVALVKHKLESEQVLSQEDRFVNEAGLPNVDCFNNDITVQSNAKGELTRNLFKEQSEVGEKGRIGFDTSSESNALNVVDKNVHSSGKESVNETSIIFISKDGLIGKATTGVSHKEDLSFQSSVLDIELSGKRSIVNEDSSILANLTDARDGDSIIPDHLAFLNQPRNLQEEGSLRSIDVFDLLDGDNDSKNKQKEDTETMATEEEIMSTHELFASQDRQNPLRDQLPHRPPGKIIFSKRNEFSSKKFLAAALKGKHKELMETLPAEVGIETIHKARGGIDRSVHTPSKSLSEMRRKVAEALERALAIRNGDASSRHSRSVSHKPQIPVENGSPSHTSVTDMSSLRVVSSREECSNKSANLETTLSKQCCLKDENILRGDDRSISMRSVSLSRQPTHPIYPMIRETDRLSGFIRRYEKKLESVCKSLLTLASVTGEEKEVLAAKELDLPEMLDFVVKQDWYKAHSTDAKFTGVPHFIFSKAKNETEGDSVGENKYTITTTGKLFLQVDGPLASDVCRFLTYLNHIEEGLTRDAMLEQWKEIAQLSEDEQSQRVCNKLDKLISFCLDSHMVKK